MSDTNESSPPSPSPRRRRLKKRRRTTSTSPSDMSDTDSDFHTNESTGSISRSASLDETPKFKVLVSKNTVRAFQKTALIDGKEQAPIVCNLVEGKYQPPAVTGLEECTYWQKVRSVFEELLHFKYKKYGRQKWIWDVPGISSGLVPHDTIQLEKGICEKVTQCMHMKFETFSEGMDVRNMQHILLGFLSDPTFPDYIGRGAVCGIVSFCMNVIDKLKGGEPRLLLFNIGGSARNYVGSSTVARFEKSVIENDREALKYLAEECKVRKRITKKSPGFETYVPDCQVMSSGRPFLTLEVKSHKGKTNDVLQTWMQALVGLEQEDTSYGVLITPEQATIYKIGVRDSQSKGDGKMCMTTTQNYLFIKPVFPPPSLESPLAFDIEQFLEFVEALIGILDKKANEN